METSENQRTSTPEQLTLKEKRDLRKRRKREALQAAARALDQRTAAALTHLGEPGALVEASMAPHDWQALVNAHYARVYQTVLGPTLALTEEGRVVFATILHDEGHFDVHIPYLNGPSVVADCAYQMLAVDQLKALGYTVNAVARRRRSLPTAKKGAQTSIVSRIHLQPPNVTFSPSYVAEIGYPVLHANISQGGAGVPQLQHLAEHYGARVTVWQHPVMVAVPAITPAMRRLVNKLRETKRCEVLRLIEIPVPRLTSG